MLSFLSLSPVELVARALAFLTAIPVHEAAHAWAADKMGDPTAKNLGRMTLNPAVHFDPIGALMMLLIGFGWAKPVPIMSRHFRQTKKGIALSSLAGPVANMLLAFVLLILTKVLIFAFPQQYLSAGSPMSIAGSILQTMVFINIYLAVFNLLPIPPLDGSKFFGAVLPDRFYNMMMRMEQYSFVIIMLLFYTGILRVPLSIASRGLYSLLNFLTGFVNLLFGR